MSAFLWLAGTAAAAYLVGAIPFGYVVARLRGVDIFTVGSGNIGATNVGRVLGRKFGVLVFLLDFAKGALPALTAMRLAQFGVETPPEWLGVAAGLTAFLGHLFPVYLGFKGGKGVATGAGVVAVLVPWAALAAVVAWLVALMSSRYVSVASVAAAVVLAGFQIVVTPQPWSGPELVVTLFCVLAALLVVVRHRTNLRRLWSGNENRLQGGNTMFVVSKVVHVLALGLWFGMVVFFTLAGGLMIQAFTHEANKDKRPYWFPVPEKMQKAPPSAKFPDPLRMEQGSRAFGVAVAPLFPWYYGIQAGCALMVAVTAVGWCLRGAKCWLHRARAALLVLALLTVGVGWWMEKVVNTKRDPRNDLTEQVIKSDNPGPQEIEAAERARSEFGMWHGFSLIQNFATLVLVTAAMGLGAFLPAAPEVHHRDIEDTEKSRELVTG